MVPPPSSSQSQSTRSGTFSPIPPATQALQTGALAQSPYPSQAGASPSTSSPTAGLNSVTKISVAQVYLLLTTLKDDKDRAKWELQADQLKKLIDDNGMDVYTKYFARLVTQHAPTIFAGGGGRPAAPNGTYPVLQQEMEKISHDPDQASKIAESIESGTEDLFRDFDLSTFMEHFKLDALEKTILALAFKFGNRPDLKTKADAILSTNFPTFVNIISRPDYAAHDDLTPSFIAAIVDRYIQGHPPNFNAPAKSELSHKVISRWGQPDQAPPMEVLAALDLMRVLAEKPQNALALYIQRTGADFTRDEDTCLGYLQNRPANVQLSEEQVSTALTYTTVSQTPPHNPSVLVAALRRALSPTFNWQDVAAYFDQRDVRMSSEQFLRLYKALLPIAQNPDANFDIQCLWGGPHWENPETQLSFICAFASLTPDELDASTIPGLQPTFTLDEYSKSPRDVQDRAEVAVKHPLVSVVALSAIFQVALHSLHASQSAEAKRLFQEVVVPNIDIFIVSAFGVPKPWPHMAIETLASLFDGFLHRSSPHETFVMDSIWRKDKEWVKQRLVDAHAQRPLDLTLIFEHVVKHDWLNELVSLPNGFGYDLAALAHAEGYLDLSQWAKNNAERGTEIAHSLSQFLIIKANLELQYQKPPEGQPPQKHSTTLQPKTVHAMLQILEDFYPKSPVHELIMLQRTCIIAYPRLINYGEGYDDIIDANSKSGNALPIQANARMEEHYKTMYGNETQVKDIVDTLNRYKHSRDSLEQDVFACMIHGLFEEYTHYVDYPLEALATTAVLFGGIISRKLISDLPLKVGLGMILEAVRDHRPEASMYKFGLQALMQLFPRLREWPGFCEQLIHIPGLINTEALRKAQEVVRDYTEEDGTNGIPGPVPSDSLTNGNNGKMCAESHYAPFASVNIHPSPSGIVFEEPSEELQDKFQFQLNNLTMERLQSTFREIQPYLEQRYQEWFASHLVEERAKMQPNYHEVYLELVKLFQDKSLSAEVLRQTYISAARMLNSESTMQNSTERTHLKYLGAWLGLLTLARDQPIKQRNIAFKQLLVEGHDTKRLIVVVPFVCKVLFQGAKSTVYRPPNPWLMDILHLLIELYHHAELKLNLKFEIEVLCKELDLDHKSIEPSQELLNRAPIEELSELPVAEAIETFDNLSLNGLAGGVAGLSPNPDPVTIPDFGSQLIIPPFSENHPSFTAARLHDMVRTALTRALQDIIQPVVDRSVTIAAISTAQMIRKDFATEPDETRVRTSAINMVKTTAGSLALVTSKEPLRANITNYMRSLASELPQGLPEGTIIMCVNSNLDLACNIIEKQAEERAIPEIEAGIEPELELRRRHRLSRGNENYVDPSLSRWAMTIPHPYKLSPNADGLNAQQMAIYEDFNRQPRAVPATSTAAHVPSTSDATRNIANEVLQDQYSSVPNLPTPAETPSLPHNIQAPQVAYPHNIHQTMTNGGRLSTHPTQNDGRSTAERVQKLLLELQRAATESREEHYDELTRGSEVVDTVDALTQFIIRASQSNDDLAFFAADKICQFLFRPSETSTLFLESLIHVLELLLKISASSGTALHDRLHSVFQSQPVETFLSIPLVATLVRTPDATNLLNLQSIDIALATVLAQKEADSIDVFEQILDLTIFNERPVAFYSDFVKSLMAVSEWNQNTPGYEAWQRLKIKLEGSGFPVASTQQPPAEEQRQYQFSYIFDEWIRHIHNQNATEKSMKEFARQLRNRGITNKEEYQIFLRVAMDMSVNICDQTMHRAGSVHDGFAYVDGLVKLISTLIKENVIELGGDAQESPVTLLGVTLALVALILNHHHVRNGDRFNQRVFFRFFSMLLDESNAIFDLSAPGSVVGQEGIEVHRRKFILTFADTLLHLAPARFPGFAWGWLYLISHRRFLPDLMNLEGKQGWEKLTSLIVLLFRHTSEHMKMIDVNDVAKDFLRATAKFLVIVQHDYPDFLVANHVQLCDATPPHAAQLRNLILFAQPRQESGETQDLVVTSKDYALATAYLQEHGLRELLDQLLQSGPSEDAIAHLTHAINRSDVNTTVFGNVPVNTNTTLTHAVVLYAGTFAVRRAQQDGNLFAAEAADMATLSMLVHELGPESRYFLLSSIVDELRYPSSPYTNYFNAVLLELWGSDINDPEEVDVRQQLVRIILERFSGYWPQPWGLLYMISELFKNDKFKFFDQPFIKADREMAERFHAMYRNVADIPLA